MIPAQGDLFAPTPRRRRYPQTPGYKVDGTSRAAAAAVASGASALRDACAKLLRDNPAGLTADEAADILKRKPGAIRPRFSELVALGLAVKMTGRAGRRRNSSGLMASIYTATEKNR